MAGSVTNKQQVLPVPAGTEVPAASITGTGDAGLDGTVAPYTFLKDASNPAGSVPLLGIAQDGTDSTATSAVQATSGVGIRGWLSTLVSMGRAATSALANVTASTSSQTLAAANAGRKGLIVVNDSTAALYIAYAGTATTTAYTYYVPGSQNGVPYTWEMPRPPYTGALSATWSGATGAARVTELT
jgi:hypothetical protein